MTEQWVTAEEIYAARARFAAATPGWSMPRAHGLVVGGEIGVWNVEEHLLPAVVLGHVLGHHGGTAALPVMPDELERAIELLSPAEACDAFEHPNLAAWRAARQNQATDVVAVFIAYV